MIPETKIAEIKSAARISEFIAPYVDLKRRGRGMVGLCPFHQEKSPSFSVSDDQGFFHCFGCGEGGNVFKFLMRIEGLTFPESVHKVADHLGIVVPEGERGSGSSSERDKLMAVAAAAARYFRRCLLETPAGEPVLAYLAERGVSDASSEAFLLGAASQSGRGLVEYLRREGFEAGAAQRLGIAVDRGGQASDRFRNRLVFPIRDPQGRVVGFGARTVGEADGPKYLNTSDSDVYHKGRILYGVFEVREARRAARRASAEEELLLVEGYLDVIALHQAGVARAVATCGTALTVDQARLMKRYGSGVVTLFDGDDAGRAAAARSFPVLLEAALWPRGCFLPDGEDPDSLVQARGAEAVDALLESARPLAEAYLEKASATGGSQADLARTGAELARVLERVSDPFEYDFLVKKAALWTGISEGVLRRRASNRSAPDQGAAPPRPRATVRAGMAGPEELLVTALVKQADLVARLDYGAIVDGLDEEPWASVLRSLFEGSGDVDTLLGDLPTGARERVARRLLDDESFERSSMTEGIADDAARKLADRARKRRNRELVERLRREEELGDANASEVLKGWDRGRTGDEEGS